MSDQFDTETEETTTRTQDFAGKIFDDHERSIALAGTNPQITKAIAKTVKQLGSNNLELEFGEKPEDYRRPILQQIIAKGSYRGSGGTTDTTPIMKELEKYVLCKQDISPKPDGDNADKSEFAGYNSADYLAIYCGFIDGVKIIREKNPQKATEIIDSFKRQFNILFENQPDPLTNESINLILSKLSFQNF